MFFPLEEDVVKPYLVRLSLIEKRVELLITGNQELWIDMLYHTTYIIVGKSNLVHRSS